MLFPEYHDRSVLALREPAQDVDPRLRITFLDRGTVQQAVKQLCHRLRSGRMQDENSLGIPLQMEKPGFLDT